MNSSLSRKSDRKSDKKSDSKSDKIKHSINESEPIIISTSTDKSTNKSINKSKPIFQVGGGYKVILTQENARIFVSEVKNLQKNAGQKQKIDTTNQSEYKDAVKKINDALSILSNDISPEKKKLEELKAQLEILASRNLFYLFTNQVNCKVIINNKEIDGNIIGMDNGVVAVAKTAQGNFIISLNTQLEIKMIKSQQKTQQKTQQGGKNPKSVISSEPDITSSSIGDSSESDEPNKESDEESEEAEESEESEEPNKESDEESEESDEESDEESEEPDDESPPTEELSTSSLSNNISSPVLKTSEYSSSVKTSVKSSDKSSDKTSSVNSSSIKSSIITETSNKSTNNNLNKNIKGGSKTKDNQKQIQTKIQTKTQAKTQTKTQTKSEAQIKSKHLSFMKAGKADNIGIIESNAKSQSIKGYYSESTSVEDGLCE